MVIKNITFNIVINERNYYNNFLSIISTYYRKYAISQHPLEVTSIYSKHIEALLTTYRITSNPF
jgi:hypothetical protein